MHVPRHGWSLVLIGVLVVAYAYHSRAQSSVKGEHEAAASPMAREASSELVAQEAALPSAAEALELQEPQDPTVAATVNETDITTALLNQRTNFVLDSRSLPPDKPLTAQEQQRRFAITRWSLLQEMVDNLLLVQAGREAEQAGTVTVPLEHVTVFLAALILKYPTEEAFQRAYPYYLSTREDFVKDQIRYKGLQKNLTAGLTITDAELQAYYQKHREEFNELGQQLSFEEAQQRAQWVTRSLKRLKAKQTMKQFVAQRRQQGSVTINLNPPGQ